MEIVEMEGEGKKALIVHPEVCDFGGACVEACLTGAFQLIKKQFGVVRYSSRDIEHLTYSRTLVCSVAVMNRSATDRLLKSVLDFDQLLLETSSG
jgi:formate hydrogenlyase subunit 6/NADH:ubiquinone oxidoreductase subunit I